jgi:hypothetical protein
MVNPVAFFRNKLRVLKIFACTAMGPSWDKMNTPDDSRRVEKAELVSLIIKNEAIKVFMAPASGSRSFPSIPTNP